jgi:hypothetical protein
MRQTDRRMLSVLLLGVLTASAFAQDSRNEGKPSEHAGARGAQSTSTRRIKASPPSGMRTPIGTPSGMRHAPGSLGTQHQFASGARGMPATKTFPGGVHALRYGNGLSGVVERSLKSGYVKRTYVEGGHAVYARIYQQHTFQRFGRTFTYLSIVPSITFSPVYYTWAMQSWSAPIRYRWGWRGESWYAAYGDNFAPYPAYTSLDLWLTDYLIAQNMRAAYQSSQTDAPDVSGSDAREQPASAPPPPTADETPSGAPPSSATAPENAGGGERAGASSDSQPNLPPLEDQPPPISSDIKAELDAQIKRQLREHQQETSASASDDTPSALKTGHTLFRVSAPLSVPSGQAGGTCTLEANDYIERTGDMDRNGTVPVQVKLSGVAHCGIGLATRVSENDLEAMDSEQQEQLTHALLAASKSMGSNGLPKAPGTAPLLVAAGRATPDANAPSTLSQVQ